MIRTPRPNWELASGDRTVATVLFVGAALLALAYVIRVAREERSVFPLALFAGAGLAVFYEPLNNVVGLCTYPEIHQTTVLSAMGRDIPLYIGAVYCFYWSAPVLWLMRRIEAGISLRQWWSWYAIATVVVTGFELIPIHRGWWAYYGDQQPLRVWGFPMWWWAVNGHAIFGLAAVLHRLRRSVLTTEASALLTIPLLPLLLFGIHGGAGIPVFLALNSSTDHAVTVPASLISIGLAFMNMWIFGRIAVGEPRRGLRLGWGSADRERLRV